MSMHCGLFPFSALYSGAFQSEALHVPHPCTHVPLMVIPLMGMYITESLHTE